MKHNLDNVDVSLTAKVQRIEAYADAEFLGNLLVTFIIRYHTDNHNSHYTVQGFVHQLKIDYDAVASASAIATKGTATATVSLT